MTLPVARQVGHVHHPDAQVILSYEDRFLRRKVLTTQGGDSFLVDLPQVTSLGAHDAFLLDDGRSVGVRPAEEALLAVTGEDLVRLAWHIGNRHTPAQIEEGRILIQEDHVLADMLAKLGASVTRVTAPFTPEGGAYGHGRTHGHDHSHPHAHDTGDAPHA